MGGQRKPLHSRCGGSLGKKYIFVALPFIPCLGKPTNLDPPGEDGLAAYARSNPAGYFKAFRCLKSHFQLPSETVIMEMGSGVGKNLCMFPAMFGGNVVVLGIEPAKPHYNFSVDTLVAARKHGAAFKVLLLTCFGNVCH